MSQSNIAIGTSDATSFGPGGAHAETVINQSNAGGGFGGDQSNFALGSSHAASHGWGPASAVTEINQSNEGFGYHGPQSNLALGTSSAEGGGFPWSCSPYGGADAHTSIDQHNIAPGGCYEPAPSCEPVHECGSGFGSYFPMPEPQVNVAVGVSTAVSLFGPASSHVDIGQENFGHGFFA